MSYYDSDDFEFMLLVKDTGEPCHCDGESDLGPHNVRHIDTDGRAEEDWDPRWAIAALHSVLEDLVKQAGMLPTPLMTALTQGRAVALPPEVMGMVLGRMGRPGVPPNPGMVPGNPFGPTKR